MVSPKNGSVPLSLSDCGVSLQVLSRYPSPHSRHDDRTGDAVALCDLDEGILEFLVVAEFADEQANKKDITELIFMVRSLERNETFL